MSDIARKAAEKCWEIQNGMYPTVQQFEGIIQSAIEKATRKLSRKCFDLTEEIAELRSQESPDTKRLDWVLSHDWSIVSNREAIDAAMKDGK